MYSYQDFKTDAADSLTDAIGKAIKQYMESEEYKTAMIADAYFRQRNITITEFTKLLYTDYGTAVADTISSNYKLCSNIYNRLITQRVTYSLGNGISFAKDGIKEKLGRDFDTILFNAAINGVNHRNVFFLYDTEKIYFFKATEFVPLFDERTGALVAGIRFWRLDEKKPCTAVLYEVDGYAKYEAENGWNDFREIEAKRAYRFTISTTNADMEAGNSPVIIGENYGRLPIVQMYGSRLMQSPIVGMRSKIDAIDLISSGWVNDTADCSQIYWLISGAGGMSPDDLKKFRDKILYQHIAAVPDSGEVKITPYTQEIPYAGRKEAVDSVRASIYEDFGGLDVHTIAAGATNDHIDAAYQPMDENADDFEYQVIKAVVELLSIADVPAEDAMPLFKRNRISNQMETTQMIIMAAQYLSNDAVRAHLPFLTVDEVKAENDLDTAEEIDRITVGGDDE